MRVISMVAKQPEDVILTVAKQPEDLLFHPR